MFSNRWLRFQLAGVLLFTAGLSSVAWSDKVYRWVDDRGQVHFSDRVTSRVKEKQVVEITAPPLQQQSEDTQRLVE